MRQIKYIVLHCTATPQSTAIQSIQDYWKNTLGWHSPGYHFIIPANGDIRKLLPVAEVANGVKGYNSNSIHISYIGGVDGNGHPIDNRSSAQIQRQILLLNELKAQFPNAIIQGHRDFPGVKKDCPSFDVKSWLMTVKDKLKFKI